MAPKKRARADSNDSERDAKHQKADDSESDASDASSLDPETERQQRDEHIHTLDRLKDQDYIAILPPSWDESLSSDDEEGKDQPSETHSPGTRDDSSPSDESEWAGWWPRPIDQAPSGHNWIMTMKSSIMLKKWSKKAEYCNPEKFNMDIPGDYYSYGLVELIEKAVDDFHVEFKKSNRRLYHTWAIIATLAHFLFKSDHDNAMLVDDGPGLLKTMEVMGYTVLTALHLIDRAGKLTHDSEFMDLGLVMSLYVRWANDQLEDQVDDVEDLDWRKNILAYAKKASIDLQKVGCRPISARYRWREDFDQVEALDTASNNRLDRWGWRRKLADHKADHGFADDMCGYGPSYDITKWSRQQRARFNAENVDPLRDISPEALLNDQLEIVSPS